MSDSTPVRPDTDAATVLLIRRPDELPEVASMAGGFVFLHGDGVDAAATLARQLGRYVPGEWRVCRTSWQRRYADAPVPAPFRVTTLVDLFERLARPGRLVCHGRGGSAKGSIVPGGRLVIDVAHAPESDLDRRETLEIALAAAALERNAAVVFGASGAAHLESAKGRGWRQLVDFGLLELWLEPCSSHALPFAGIKPADAAAATRLRREAAARLLL